MNNPTGTLRIFFYVALPYKPHIYHDTTRVEYARRTLFTAYAVTQEEAACVAKEFKEKNEFGKREVTAVWQQSLVELD